MSSQAQLIGICNVCYRCREYINTNEDPRMKKRLFIFSQIHKDHPHGMNPRINLANYVCVDAKIDAKIRD